MRLPRDILVEPAVVGVHRLRKSGEGGESSYYDDDSLSPLLRLALASPPPQLWRQEAGRTKRNRLRNPIAPLTAPNASSGAAGSLTAEDWPTADGGLRCLPVDESDPVNDDRRDHPAIARHPIRRGAVLAWAWGERRTTGAVKSRSRSRRVYAAPRPGMKRWASVRRASADVLTDPHGVFPRRILVIFGRHRKGSRERISIGGRLKGLHEIVVDSPCSGQDVAISSSLRMVSSS